MDQKKRKAKKEIVTSPEPHRANRDHDAILRIRESYKKHGLTPAIIKSFQKIILSFFKKHGRQLPWRETTDPYRILVSEIMLQQTQVDRVIDKYREFIDLFPTVEVLAGASLQEVLNAWLGLGYNRRAIALRKSAQKITAEFNGAMPQTEKELVQLNGVGKYTAAALGAFAFNQAVVLVETNVRAVYIHFFFSNQQSVEDKEIASLVEDTMDRSNPRQWYNALMDYGVMLKKEFPNPSRKSAHYAKQSRFEGSDRQIRGKILRILGDGKTRRKSTIIKALEGKESGRIEKIIQQLLEEGFLEKRRGGFAIR